MTTDISTDRVERSIHIKAPRSKVWHALTHAEEYGKWFGAKLTGKRFEPGQRVQGPITIQGYEHVVFDVVIDRVEPETLMSYRWRRGGLFKGRTHPGDLHLEGRTRWHAVDGNRNGL